MKYLIFQASLGWDPTKCLSEETKAKLTNAGFNIQDKNQDELCLEEDMQTCYDQTSYITLNSIKEEADLESQIMQELEDEEYQELEQELEDELEDKEY